MTRLPALLAVVTLALLAIHATTAASAPQTAPDASQPSLETRTREAYARLALHAFSRSAPEEAAFLDRTGGGDPSPPSAPGLFMALDQEAGDTKAGGAGAGSAAPSADLPASADLDLADWALATPRVGFGGLHPIAESWYRGTAAGIASWMGEGYGAGYLALPIGPGFRVRLCGAADCVEMTSNDAGPDLAMQRRGRVADVAVGVWERITGLPRRLGLAQITVTVLGRP